MLYNNSLFECRPARFGQGLFATRQILPGEIVAIFDGPKYDAGSCRSLPTKDIADHAIQIGPHTWRDSAQARYINHSCDPNCGFMDEIRLRALRLIQPGEQLEFDYDTCEDSDWSMKCHCGSVLCRKNIGTFARLIQQYPKRVQHYRELGIIHPWLIEKYNSEFKNLR